MMAPFGNSIFLFSSIFNEISHIKNITTIIDHFSCKS